MSKSLLASGAASEPIDTPTEASVLSDASGTATPRQPFVLSTKDYIRFLDARKALAYWRDADHEDAIKLTRNDVCTILDGIEEDHRVRKELAKALVQARTMLSNYAAYDERHGLADDAAYTRRRIAEIDATLAGAK